MRLHPPARVWLTLPAVVMTATVLGALPGLTLPANPQHMDQARAFLRGTVWIDHPTATHDLGQAHGRWFSPFPPLPACVAAAAITLSPNPDLAYNLIVLACALAAVALAWTLGRLLGGPAVGAWSTLALGLGTGLWTATAIHDTYHSAHVFAILFALGAIRAVIAARPRWWLAGLLLGLAALSRQPVILGVPFLPFLAGRGRTTPRPRTAASLLLAAALPFAAYLALNAARFGTPFDSGYAAVNHAPDIERDLVAHGAFSFSYLPRNLGTMLAATPHIVGRFPFLIPDPGGLSLLIVSPWLVLALVPLFRPDRPGVRRMAGACALAAAMITVPHLLYVNAGWAQFGYRFALDETPFLLAAAILAVRRMRPVVPWLAASWSGTVHLWGLALLWSWPRWSSLLSG